MRGGLRRLDVGFAGGGRAPIIHAGCSSVRNCGSCGFGEVALERDIYIPALRFCSPSRRGGRRGKLVARVKAVLRCCVSSSVDELASL